MKGTDDVPTEALEDIAYLVRSPNRVRILRVLVSASASSRELRDRTGTSKTTCNRILNEFVERSLVRQTVDGDYKATPQAEHLAVQLRPFVESIAAIRGLGDGAAILPADELTWGPDGQLTLGAHHFADAAVKWKQPQQHGVGREEVADAFRTTDTIHSVSDGSPPRVVGEVLQDRADRGDLSGIMVLTTDLFEYLRDRHGNPPDWSDVIDSGVEMYRYEGDTPDNLTATDEATFVWRRTADGETGVVISETDAVRKWGIDVVKRYRDRAERLEPAAFD